ncbi:MAG TPA: hypothetical protein VFX59_00410 [Polyangiales bacterium]|nr:hypothetical protein [Polyangiales bacterium]
MKRAIASLLTCSLACTALAQDATPDLVLTDDKPALAPPTEQPPVLRIEADDQPDLAFADATDPNPGAGSGQIIAGWIATGIGLAGVAQSSTCGVEVFDVGLGQRRCRNVGIVFGVVGLGLGIPWLVFGYQKRRALRDWKQRHGLTALPELDFAGDSLRLRF